ncbi:sensor histidine kinase [Dyella sp. 20L07]|uniref:sensor histidine kinase n=1 Tax=Dyella sp. 20L07 TaxID=3384240 RepID=UPI003D2E6501
MTAVSTAIAGNMRRVWRITLATLLLLLANGAGHAEPSEFHRKLWTIEQGAPADIWALAQGHDGYLWLGTGTGLYRFDGVRFERFEPPLNERFGSNDITALTMLPDGTLWVGFYYGGASVIRQRHVQNYVVGADFPSGTVLTFAQSDDGAIWAASEGGLARFDGRHWETIGAAWNYPAKRADWLIVDGDGTLWVTTGDDLVFLRAGSHRFEHTNQAVDKYAVVAQAPDGTLWLSDHRHGTRALRGLTVDHPALDHPADDTAFSEAYRLLFDRYGGLWGTHVSDHGIYRINAIERLADGHSLGPQDVAETIDRSSGLMSNRTVPLLQDAEGTIWAGTNLGLASFHRNSFTVPPQITPGSGQHYAMAADHQGVVWLADAGALLRMDGQGNRVVKQGLPDIRAALFDRSDVLWLLGESQLLTLRGNTLDSIELPPLATESKVSAFTFDRNDAPLIAIAQHGLFRYEKGTWSALGPTPELSGQTPTALAIASDGDVWIGYPGDRVAVFNGHAARLYTAADGLQVGNVTTINITRREVMIGGELGLARLRDGHVDSLVISDDDAFSGITGITQASNGDLWLNGGKGALQIAASEVTAAFQHPGYRPAYRLFDYRDGLPGIAMQASRTPTALIDGEQRVWMLTSQGPAWIQPDNVGSNMLPPPVAILALNANGNRYASSPTPVLPKGTDNLQLSYTALSLANPERVRFRYKLDGVDAGWIDAGNRREAFYSNLRPGTYRFHVIAANDDGVWNLQGDSVRFIIKPWFFQTLWFYTLIASLAIALAVTFFFWRMRLAANRVHMQMMERMGERERIARDIHDTLLQGVQGLLLRLQALLVDMSPDDKRSNVLKTAIVQARQMVIEGRDKIIALRGDGPQYTELVQSLLAVGENLASIYPTAFHITTEGKPRALLPSAFDEILDVIREGIRNAFIHAEAKRVDVHVAYETRALRIVVTDDGTGIDEAALKDAANRGHWGVIGMRERARQLGARLTLSRRHPHGTELLLSVPCRAAYKPDKRDTR